MVTKIQKWGNSLGLRIPKSFAAEANIEAGSEVDISVREKEIIVRRAKRAGYKLEDLLASVSKKNIHEEIDTGDPVGREVW
jgi:antitoxin MazE